MMLEAPRLQGWILVVRYTVLGGAEMETVALSVSQRKEVECRLRPVSLRVRGKSGASLPAQ